MRRWGLQVKGRDGRWEGEDEIRGHCGCGWRLTVLLGGGESFSVSERRVWSLGGAFAGEEMVYWMGERSSIERKESFFGELDFASHMYTWYSIRIGTCNQSVIFRGFEMALSFHTL